MINISSLLRRCVFAIAAALMLAGLGQTAAAQPRYQTVISTDGTPLAITTDGLEDGPAILFIHGLAQSSLSWSAQFGSDLAQTHRLIAFDLRGHGASGKPWAEGAYSEARWAEDVSAVLAATGARRPLVVAWSYGSYVINDYVRAHGAGALSGIVYVGATGGVAAPPMTGQNAGAAEAFNRIRQSQTSPNLNDQIEGARLSSGYLFARPVDDAIRRRSFDASLMLPGYARTQLYARRFDSQGVETSLRDLPVLFLGGREDGAYAGDVPAQIQRALPHAQIILYDGVGHSPFLEEPARFNADLLRFEQHIAEQARRAARQARRR